MVRHIVARLIDDEKNALRRGIAYRRIRGKPSRLRDHSVSVMINVQHEEPAVLCIVWMKRHA